MSRQWQRIVAEPDYGSATVVDGRLFQGIKITVSDETIERIRQGYQCIECLEVCKTAYRCPNAHLGCPMARLGDKDAREAERQWKERFAMSYKGHVPGARTGADWEAEADRLEERKERRAFERRAAESGLAIPGAGVVIPKNV